MDIFSDIAKQMSPEERKTLARFRAAAKDHEKLPAELDALPSGFLHCSIEGGEVVGVLSPFGMRVAIAAETMAAKGEAA